MKQSMTKPLAKDRDVSIDIGELPRRRRLRAQLRLVGVCSDLLAIAVGFILANILRFDDAFHAQGMNMLILIVPIYFSIVFNRRAYSVKALTNSNYGSANAVFSFGVALAAIGLVVFFLKVSTDFSRVVFGVGAVSTATMLPVFRFLIAVFIERKFADRISCDVVIEDGVAAPTTAGAVFIDANREYLQPKLDDPEMLDRLGRYLMNSERVIVACASERRAAWASALNGASVQAEIFATDLEELGAIGLSRFRDHSTVVVATGPLRLSDRILKRALDLMAVLLSLPVTLPLFGLIALLVKFDSPGPVLFRQTRIGLGNRHFTMYKFRSMKIEHSDSHGSTSTGREDERITRIGRFIRSSSLDELPQLINVLQGAMSIVGPRPHALASRAEDLLFWDIDLTYWHRHAAKPGLTGLAQVRGLRGTTEKTEDLRKRLESDLEYLSGWTIWRDIGIILATVRVVIHRNAF